uniref:Perilipin-3 n=1 Tax=Otus sunia TaxID=257818 RepID=A0A8C8AD17_9STRI
SGSVPSCPQSIGTRVASLPLVSSAYDMVSTAYASTKESHPYVKSVCDAAEKGVKTLTAAAVSGAQPILTKLEPQSEWGWGGGHRALARQQGGNNLGLCLQFI